VAALAPSRILTLILLFAPTALASTAQAQGARDPVIVKRGCEEGTIPVSDGASDWFCAPMPQDSNAATVCDGGQVLLGDGTCAPLREDTSAATECGPNQLLMGSGLCFEPTCPPGTELALGSDNVVRCETIPCPCDWQALYEQALADCGAGNCGEFANPTMAFPFAEADWDSAVLLEGGKRCSGTVSSIRGAAYGFIASGDAACQVDTNQEGGESGTASMWISEDLRGVCLADLVDRCELE
jgi:hypothetical protein